ncbi:hypothetical protein B7494_g3811 [Chlorociboria aeruginascens]|nr:hypothetical protein B7494_g3811 [Chlorociboria aeruginascens]
MNGKSASLKATFAAAPYSAELKSLSSEDKVLDYPGATLNGDASNVINVPAFTEVLCATCRGATGTAVEALGNCCSRLGRCVKRTDCSALENRDSPLEYMQLLPFRWHGPHTGVHESHRVFARMHA